MKNRDAQWHVVLNHPGEPLLIEDDGPWTQHFTITNDAEGVVAKVVARGLLPEGRRLFYVDSEGQTDELVVKDGRFVGFAPGPMPPVEPPETDFCSRCHEHATFTRAADGKLESDCCNAHPVEAV